jgi:hypothetical protein
VLPDNLNAEVIVVVGVGVVEVGDLDEQTSTNEPTARWTITRPKHEASGNTLRAQTAILPEMAILVEMPALQETMLEEAMRKRTTIAGTQVIAGPIGFTTNKQGKYKMKFGTAQRQSP